MNSKALISALLAVSMISGTGASFAQRHDDDRGHQDDRRDDRRGDWHDRRDFHPGYDRGHARYERGAGPSQSFHRGDRLPPQYRERRYVVSDWRARHLSAPPRGYQWVQTGGDLVLVAIATGVITQLLLSN